jgi:hypothetical protein
MYVIATLADRTLSTNRRKPSALTISRSGMATGMAPEPTDFMRGTGAGTGSHTHTSPSTLHTVIYTVTYTRATYPHQCACAVQEQYPSPTHSKQERNPLHACALNASHSTTAVRNNSGLPPPPVVPSRAAPRVSPLLPPVAPPAVGEAAGRVEGLRARRGDADPAVPDAPPSRYTFEGLMGGGMRDFLKERSYMNASVSPSAPGRSPLRRRAAPPQGEIDKQKIVDRRHTHEEEGVGSTSKAPHISKCLRSAKVVGESKLCCCEPTAATRTCLWQ